MNGSGTIRAVQRCARLFLLLAACLVAFVPTGTARAEAETWEARACNQEHRDCDELCNWFETTPEGVARCKAACAAKHNTCSTDTCSGRYHAYTDLTIEWTMRLVAVIFGLLMILWFYRRVLNRNEDRAGWFSKGYGYLLAALIGALAVMAVAIPVLQILRMTMC